MRLPFRPSKAQSPPPRVSARLDALITNAVERSFLRVDGWWADLVLEQFGFLEDHGMTVRVSFHFKEHTIQYLGAVHYVTFLYARGRLCRGWLDQLGTDAPRNLDDIITEWTHRKPPTGRLKDRESITRRIEYWASGFREFAPSMLGGE